MREDDFIEEMILAGGIEVSGMDPETGEFLYSFTPKIQELAPEMYRISTEHFEHMTMTLWQKGFLEIDLLSENPMVRLEEKALHQETWVELSVEEKSALQVIMTAMRNN